MEITWPAGSLCSICVFPRVIKQVNSEYGNVCVLSLYVCIYNLNEGKDFVKNGIFIVRGLDNILVVV